MWRLTSLSSFFGCSCQLGLPYLLVSDTESGSRSVESPSSASGRSPFARMRPFHDLSVAPCLDPLMLFPSCSGRPWFKLLGQGQTVASTYPRSYKKCPYNIELRAFCESILFDMTVNCQSSFSVDGAHLSLLVAKHAIWGQMVRKRQTFSCRGSVDTSVELVSAKLHFTSKSPSMCSGTCIGSAVIFRLTIIFLAALKPTHMLCEAKQPDDQSPES